MNKNSNNFNLWISQTLTRVAYLNLSILLPTFVFTIPSIVLFIFFIFQSFISSLAIPSSLLISFCPIFYPSILILACLSMILSIYEGLPAYQISSIQDCLGLRLHLELFILFSYVDFDSAGPLNQWMKIF